MTRKALLAFLACGALSLAAGFVPARRPVVRPNVFAEAPQFASAVQLQAEPSAVLEQLLVASRSADADELRTVVRRNLDFCDFNFINFLQSKMESAEDVAFRDELSEIMTQVNIQLRKRLKAADDQLRSILEAGDLKAMESRMKQLLRLGEVDTAFMVVLNMNMGQAREAGAETAANVLQHLNTYIQQEQDALVPANTRLLRMLLRTECDGARENILREKLILPDDLQSTIGVPQEQRIWGEPEVDPADLQQAITGLRDEADKFGPEVSGILRERCDGLRDEVNKVLSGQLKGLACETGEAQD